MILGARVDSWRGPQRLAMDLPVVSWAWSEKWPALPAGKFTADFPATLWPETVVDALAPMGQVLRVEIMMDGRAFPLPPLRIVEAVEGSGVVSVSCESIDGAVADDPWPVPSSPAPGARLAGEAARLAAPLRVVLAEGVPNPALRDGIAWSGDRDEALLDLASSHGLRVQADMDGTLTLIALGNPGEPVAVVSGREVVEADRKRSRKRANRATVIVEAGGAIERTLTRTLTAPDYAPDVYGLLGRVKAVKAGDDLERTADALLAEQSAPRDFTITARPDLRAGMPVWVEVPRPDGVQRVAGRVESFTLRSTGEMTITLQEVSDA